MCKFKSALVLKDRIFLPDYDNHDKMLHELGIEDNFTNASKVFVRVELSPEDGDIFRDVDGWELKVDQDILPDWWNEAERLPKLKELVERWIQKHTISGEYKVADGVWLATGIAMVKTCGNATVKAYDGATVTAYDRATVTAYGSATVIIPKRFATDGVIKLNDDSVCINHKTHTIRSAIKWKLEG